MINVIYNEQENNYTIEKITKDEVEEIIAGLNCRVADLWKYHKEKALDLTASLAQAICMEMRKLDRA